MKLLRRHDLVEISEAGRRIAYEGVAPRLRSHQLRVVKDLIIGSAKAASIPGIVRREEGESYPDMIPVGFSSPFRVDGNRLRIAAFVPVSEVKDAISPFAVLRRDYIPRTPCLEALAEISAVAEEMQLELGVWGSAALEIFTGLHYTDQDSDLDLLISLAGMETITCFQTRFLQIAKRFACKADVEIDLPSGYGIKLTELFMNTETVLAKGFNDVILLSKCDILAILAEVQ